MGEVLGCTQPTTAVPKFPHGAANDSAATAHCGDAEGQGLRQRQGILRENSLVANITSNKNHSTCEAYNITPGHFRRVKWPEYHSSTTTTDEAESDTQTFVIHCEEGTLLHEAWANTGGKSVAGCLA